MRWWFGRDRASKTTMAAPRPSARFSVDIPPELVEAMTAGGMLAPRISRELALQVPAVLRARNLICSIATLPVRVHAPDRRVVTATNADGLRGRTYLMPDPDPNIAQCVMMAQTIEDLLFESVSWWRVTRLGWHDYPIEATHVPLSSVHVAPTGALLPSQAQISPDNPYPVDGQVYIDGYPVPDREVIRFDSPNPPLLRHAARAIRTCLLLDTAAALYAKDPLPLGYFTPDPDAESPPDDDDVQQILDDWEARRRERAWPYLGAHLKAQTLQWNPEQLQLADQRQHAVLEIARATGLDAEDLGVAVTSRTYANQDQRGQALINLTLGAYVSTIQQRLSMRDVLPRGYYSQIDFGGFLRGDLLTRMQAYEVGLRVGAYVDEEVRELEDRPPLTPAQQAARRAAAAARQPATPGTQQHRENTVHFATGDKTMWMQFEASTEDFQVDTSRRTITGLLLPWNRVANNGIAKWKFRTNSVGWSQVSRIKLNRHHDSRDLIAVATRLQAANRGLVGTFKVGRGPEGDRALEAAEDGILDGFSVEVEFDSAESWEPDPQDPSVRLVNQATLRGVALTGAPAFDDARLVSVKASRDQKGNDMPDEKGTETGATFDIGQLAQSMADSHKKLTEELTTAIGESISAGVKAALEDIAAPQDGPQPVRAARFVVTREAPIYSLDGAGSSMVRDAWYAAREHDADAQERLRRFRVQTDDMAKLAHHAYRLAAAGGSARFAADTTSAAAIIPPGYRPDLFVPQLGQGRPLVNALSVGVISNATPFVLPVFVAASGVTDDHEEGINPSDGTLTLTTKTVTPGAISGRLDLTREIVDSSNPAIDQIALNAMRESYGQQTEAKAYTMLNGADGVGGTIAGTGLVPSGAQAATFAATGGDHYPEELLIKGVRAQLARYPFRRFAAPTQALMGQNATTVLATVTDSTGRPLFPSVGAQNAMGLGNAVTQGWEIDGLAHTPAWAMTGTAAGDAQIITLNRLDAWAWESPLLTFRYEEKSGPAKIELALFGYFATHVLRPVGLSGIRITPAGG